MTPHQPQGPGPQQWWRQTRPLVSPHLPMNYTVWLALSGTMVWTNSGQRMSTLVWNPHVLFRSHVDCWQRISRSKGQWSHLPGSLMRSKSLSWPVSALECGHICRHITGFHQLRTRGCYVLGMFSCAHIYPPDQMLASCWLPRCLSYFSISMTKYHDQGIKESI